jgi:predicted alpha/beta hydrolase family esterase
MRESNPERDNDARILIVPGLYNSGPQHWQTLWEQEHPHLSRIEQRDWDTPVCADWTSEIDRAVTSGDVSKVVLVAHSLGCIAVAHWAMAYHRSIRGALLVAPSDVEAAGFPAGTHNFSPPALERLPFRSIVVGSNDDPYITVQRAEMFARSWGSEYVDLGGAGHINASAGFGRWEFGYELVQRLASES